MGEKKILIVDDEEINLLILSKMIKKLNHEFISFSSSEVALKHIREHKDDVSIVFSDYYMPHLNGVELCEETKIINPDIRFFLLTGAIDQSELERSNNIEKNITKPISFEALKSILN